tara:strand:- start:2995 stop:3621 length:627 start_codon:yes stop_codon:yes gene_type:complete
MVSNGYQFDRDSVRKLKADHETLKRRLQHLEQLIRTGLGSGTKEQQVIVKASELIPAIDSDDCLGTGKAKIYELSRETSQTQAADGTYYYDYCYSESKREEIRIYNPSAVPVASDTFVRCERHSKSGLWLIDPVQTAVGVSNGITGRSGTTAGTGTASLYYISSGNLVDTGENVTVYNIADATVASGSWITIKQNSYGQWFVDMEACG